MIQGDVIMEILNLILSIISGLCICIPLVITLVKHIKIAIAEKNFGYIMSIVIELLPEAEEKFHTGEERKAYVMEKAKYLSESLGHDIDMNRISIMIDSIIAITKKVNK
jgi:hypothetical protein